PTGVGDLQRGKKFTNMDYILYSSISGTEAQSLDISYGISCIWIKNAKTRIEKLPPEMRDQVSSINIRPLIPKFHLAAHIQTCQSPFAWNLLPGCAQADGEEIERVWAGHNDVGKSTKEMALGHRWDVLDSFFGNWNWRKYLKFGMPSVVLD
ncbi:hypothetical protein M422DRAFT_173780, partial [Sphaerobolus stellatus SS14]